jgi:hypothetical protein
VTVTGPAGEVRAAIAEYAGVAAANPFDAGSCNGGSGPEVTTGGPAAVDGGELVVAGLSSSANPVLVEASSIDGMATQPRTLLSGDEGTIGIEDVTQAPSGGQSASMSIDGNLFTGWNACIATFDAAVGPASKSVPISSSWVLLAGVGAAFAVASGSRTALRRASPRRALARRRERHRPLSWPSDN